MTQTLAGVSAPTPPEEPQEPRPPSAEELAAARELVRAARDRGVALTGPDGLLKALSSRRIGRAGRGRCGIAIRLTACIAGMRGGNRACCHCVTPGTKG